LEDVDDDLAADMYEWAAERLERAGYQHYEISNWARPGRESQHNLVYWHNQPYLGLGASAHSWYAGRRWANVGDPATYIARVWAAQGEGALETVGPAADEVQAIDARLEMSETMMMGLRLLQGGVSDDRFEQRFGVSVEDIYHDEIEAAVAEGLLERIATPGGKIRLRLTRRGHLLGNRVFLRFVGD
jgi:oxygen-independent coproporphyrinogen-3 oxidase